MDLFESDLQFSKIIFRNKFYYPEEINASIKALVSYLGTNIKQSNSPFVYLFAANHIKTIIAYFAIIKSNRICILVDPEIKHLELKEMKQDTPPYAMIKFDKETDAFDYQKDIMFTNNNIDIDSKEIEDVCTMVYTNAEDGFAKAAMLTKKNLVSNAQSGVESDDINKINTFYALLPLYHMFGLQTGVLTPLLAGASTVIEDISDLKHFRTSAAFIKKYQVTNFYSIPMIYYLFTKIPQIENLLESIDRCCAGGYKLSPNISHLFKDKAGKEILEGYGLTEASPVCSWFRLNDKNKPGSVGQAYSCCDIKIINGNKFAGTTGEICIKGSNIMKGYYNNNDATKAKIINEWLHTGDLGYLDKDGSLYINGMKKRMFIVSGNNVYPAEIIRLIQCNDNVESVEISGEENELQCNNVCAHINLENNGSKEQENFNNWCKKNITHYKIPQKIIFL